VTLRIIGYVFTFVIGVVISVLAESSLRSIIQTFLKFFTDNSIHFFGKDFHLFASVYYYLSFGLFGLVTLIYWNVLEGKRKLSLILSILSFIIWLVVICYFYGALKIIECTACNDGIRNLHYNEVAYDGIIISSLLLSIMPMVLLNISKHKLSKIKQ
jgi:hypothetical protein